MIKELIAKVIEGKNLTVNESRKAVLAIMSGKTSQAQIGAFLTAMRMKGETVQEITGAALAMREKATTIDVRANVDIEEGLPQQEAILDTCGTGGSAINTFNISTCVAFVIAGCGIKVAKHGNRSASSLCGSADVIEALGVNIDIPVKRCEEAIKSIGICFLYAPNFHKAMQYVREARREIGIRTLFNILGPLANPAKANAQVVGVYDACLTEVVAGVLKNLGVRHAFVVCGRDGLDEITITTTTKVTELKDNKIKTFEISPRDFGIRKAPLASIRGGDAARNAQIILSILKSKGGPCRDIVLMNAAAALVACQKAGTFREAVSMAGSSIDSKSAIEKLIRLKEFTNKFRQ